MKYLISRTSSYGDENAPFEGAVQEHFEVKETIDKRTYMSTTIFGWLIPNPRADRVFDGIRRNHKYEETETTITYVTDKFLWSLEIADLHQWIKELNNEVIITWNENLNLFEIEIYDDYRE